MQRTHTAAALAAKFLHKGLTRQKYRLETFESKSIMSTSGLSICSMADIVVSGYEVARSKEEEGAHRQIYACLREDSKL